MADENTAKLAYTIEEAASLLSISRAHFYRLLDLGEIDSIQLGRCRRITRSQLLDFIRRMEASSCQVKSLSDLTISVQKQHLRGFEHG